MIKSRMILVLWLSVTFSCLAMDVEFINQPCLTPVKSGDFELCNDMVVRVNERFHIVPQGFVTDLASIPRILWPFFSPSDYEAIGASVLHDWQYCCEYGATRKYADDVFYFGLLSNGMGNMQALTYWSAVRFFGWMFFIEGDR